MDDPAMHIDKDAAELLAQVIPALLIVLVLEGRLPKPEGKISIWRKAHAMLRNFTAFLSLGAEFFCLLIVVQGESIRPGYFDVGIIVGVLLLMVCIYLMLIRLMMRELRDNI